MNNPEPGRTRVISLQRDPLDVARTTLKAVGLGNLEDYEIAGHQGIHSIVLFSRTLPDHVMKIPLGNRSHDFFINEVEALRHVEKLDIKTLDVVRLVQVGHDPAYAVMTRLGPTLTDVWNKTDAPSTAEIRNIGCILAEFVVELHQKSGGMVHRDLHYENLTQQPNGRYGCLDFGDYGPGDLEDAFIQVAVRELNIIHIVSERVRELTGKGLDLEKLRQKALVWIENWDK